MYVKTYARTSFDRKTGEIINREILWEKEITEEEYGADMLFFITGKEADAVYEDMCEYYRKKREEKNNITTQPPPDTI